MSTESTSDVPEDRRPIVLIEYEQHGYVTSTDYELLARVMMTRRLVVMVDYHGCRDAATTRYRSGSSGEEWEIGTRGLGYVWATDRAHFLAQCKRLNVQVLLPADMANAEMCQPEGETKL